MSEKRFIWFSASVVALLCAATFVVFWPALSADFVQWDDNVNIYANPHVRGLTAENLRWMFTDVAYVRRYMPLAWLNWAVSHAVAGLGPRACHIGNLLFHAANAVMIYVLFARLLRAATGEKADAPDLRARTCAALGALLWAVHPLRVECVAWASARIYQQALFFALLSLVCYLHYAMAPPEQRGRIFLGLSAASLAASLFTYPIGLAVGAIPLVLDWYPLRRLRRQPQGWWTRANARLLLEKIPFALAIGIVLGITVWARVRFAGRFEPPISLEQFGVPARAMQGFYIWAYYAWKPWIPTGLAPVYTTLVWFQPGDGIFVASALAVVGVTGLLFWQRHRWPVLWVAWLCHLLLLVPVLGLTEHPHYPNDRYSYFAAIPLALVLVTGLERAVRVPALRAVVLVGSLALVTTWGVWSRRQTHVWHDSFSLFHHTLARLGNNSYRGDIHWRLGVARAQQGELDEAIVQFRSALQFLPQWPDPHEDFADALVRQGKLPEAIEHYEAAVRGRSTPSRVAKLAEALAAHGQSAAAVVRYREALAVQPDAPDILNNLAWLLATDPDPTIRNGTEAMNAARRACELTGHRVARLLGTLGAACAEAGQFDEAIATAEKARKVAIADGEKDVAARNAELIELYRRRMPVRSGPVRANP